MGEYMAFMISRETENVGSSQEVENAFRALTEGGKRPYVTEAELYQVSTHWTHLAFIIPAYTYKKLLSKSAVIVGNANQSHLFAA